ncbi:hypothetical protein JYT74_00280 [Crocinitomix catalasitica]|nr:hypothetical protein [Crocinitomix catalasitica]
MGKFKENRYLCLVVLAIIILSCGGEKETEEEFTPIYPPSDEPAVLVDNQGLSCLKAYMSINGLRDQQEALYGSLISMNFQKIEGFIIKDRKVNIETTHLVLNDETGDTLYYEPFGQNPAKWYEVSDTSAVEFHTAMQIEDPLFCSSADKLSWTTGIHDVSSQKKIFATTKLRLLPNPVFEISKSGLEYAELYLYNSTKNKVVLNNQVEIGDVYNLVLARPQGFTLEGEMVFPGIQIWIKNADDKVIFEIEDLAASANEGVPVSSTESGLAPYFSIGEADATFNIHLYVKFWDKKSDAAIEVKADLIVSDLQEKVKYPDLNF